jgi:hypothetical protein
VNRLRFSFVLFLALTCGPQLIRAQQLPSLDQIPLAPPALVGSIENTGGQFRLNLTNTDLTRAFRGTAHISLGNAMDQMEAGKLAVALAPQESRLFQLTALRASGEQYALRIYDQNDLLIFYKVAPVKRVFDAGRPTAMSAMPAPPPSAAATPPASGEGEVKVEPRLAGGERDNDPFVLAFEVASPKPLLNATFSISAKGLQERKPINVQGRVNIEFKLPDEFDDRKVNYTLTDATGRVVARGEADLDQLLTDDFISVNEVKLDRPAYALGESAHVILMLQGGSKHGYRLEVTARDGRGNTFFRDSRKGVSEGGKSLQEFAVTLPRETAGPIVFEYKVYDAETGTLFDSGEREIAITSTGGGEAIIR